MNNTLCLTVLIASIIELWLVYAIAHLDKRSKTKANDISMFTFFNIMFVFLIYVTITGNVNRFEYKGSQTYKIVNVHSYADETQPFTIVNTKCVTCVNDSNNRNYIAKLEYNGQLIPFECSGDVKIVTNSDTTVKYAQACYQRNINIRDSYWINGEYFHDAAPDTMYSYYRLEYIIVPYNTTIKQY